MSDQIDAGAEHPLVTFILFSFNQEKYIRAAIEGAFCQTWQPLEIILSDDGSTDGTFGIMQEMAAAYRGPHRIVVRQSPRNLGIGPHVAAATSLAAGEFLVFAAGDDISYPERTTVLAGLWLESGRNAMAIDSGFDAIDRNGAEIPHQGKRQARRGFTFSSAIESNEFITGATAAYDRRIFSEFPPILKTTVHEDCILPFRAFLLGGYVDAVDKALIAYRQEVGISATYRSKRSDALVFSTRVLSDHIQKIVDSRSVGRFDICLAISDRLVRYASEAHALSSEGSISSLLQLVRYGGLKWGPRAYLKTLYRRFRERR